MAKSDVPNMIRGLGIANSFILGLMEKIRERGGCEEMIYALTTPQYRDNLDHLAQLIVSLPWRRPVTETELMELVYESGSEDVHLDEEDLKNDMHFCWTGALRRLGIPFIPFSAEGHAFFTPEATGIPDELKRQLHGKEALSGMMVEWNGQPFVVTCIGIADRARGPDLREVIDAEQITNLDIAHSHHFDLTR